MMLCIYGGYCKVALYYEIFGENETVDFDLNKFCFSLD